MTPYAETPSEEGCGTAESRSVLWERVRARPQMLLLGLTGSKDGSPVRKLGHQPLVTVEDVLTQSSVHRCLLVRRDTCHQ